MTNRKRLSAIALVWTYVVFGMIVSCAQHRAQQNFSADGIGPVVIGTSILAMHAALLMLERDHFAQRAAKFIASTLRGKILNDDSHAEQSKHR